LLSSCSRPDFTYADGSAGNFEDWRGNWVFINYWAEWCAPCRHEIPELNDLHAAHVTQGALVIGVNYDGLRDAELHDVMERMDVRFPVMTVDPHQQLGYERPQRLPTTFILNPDGEVVAALEGPQTRAELEEFVEPR
jgi:thiol-disulfide isomerase/thioredoxin